MKSLSTPLQFAQTDFSEGQAEPSCLGVAQRRQCVVNLQCLARCPKCQPFLALTKRNIWLNFAESSIYRHVMRKALVFEHNFGNIYQVFTAAMVVMVKQVSNNLMVRSPQKSLEVRSFDFANIVHWAHIRRYEESASNVLT